MPHIARKILPLALANDIGEKMGITLFDQETDEVIFDINFWHWRAIVEAVRALNVLAEPRLEALHDAFVGELTQEEAHAVGVAISEKLLPTLTANERLLLDGKRTHEPDDGTFYKDPAEQHKNYSTNRDVLEKFAAACAMSHGFRVS